MTPVAVLGTNLINGHSVLRVSSVGVAFVAVLGTNLINGHRLVSRIV